MGGYGKAKGKPQHPFSAGEDSPWAKSALEQLQKKNVVVEL